MVIGKMPSITLSATSILRAMIAILQLNNSYAGVNLLMKRKGGTGICVAFENCFCTLSGDFDHKFFPKLVCCCSQ